MPSISWDIRKPSRSSPGGSFTAGAACALALRMSLRPPPRPALSAPGYPGYRCTTTYGGTYVPTEDGCFITLEVDEKEIVRKWAYEGNLSGCEPYINALKKK